MFTIHWGEPTTWEEVDKRRNLTGKDLQVWWRSPWEYCRDTQYFYRGPIKQWRKRKGGFYQFELDWVARIWEGGVYAETAHTMDGWEAVDQTPFPLMFHRFFGVYHWSTKGLVFFRPDFVSSGWVFLSTKLLPAKVKGLAGKESEGE